MHAIKLSTLGAEHTPSVNQSYYGISFDFKSKLCMTCMW